MALPAQLKSARITSATAVSGWPVTLGQLEQAICDILGIPIDTNILVPVGGATRYATISDSNVVSNVSVATLFNKSYVIPANTLQAGDLIRIYSHFQVSLASGVMSLGTVSQGSPSAYLGFQQVGGVQSATAYWNHIIHLLIRSIGVAGVAWAGIHAAPLLPPSGTQQPGLGASAGTLTIDTTANFTIGWSAAPSVANVGNTATLLVGTVEILHAGSTG